MKITIIGLGLIGGSIALKLRKSGFASYIYGVESNLEHSKVAKDLEIIDELTNTVTGVEKADIIIVAVPVNVAITLLPEILDYISPNQMVMDVGSTKQQIAKIVENHPNRRSFVAYHPMWGTENSGPNAATSYSFSGKAAVICDQEKSASNALEKALMVTEALEMHPIFMDSAAHDIHTAYISHISHITSYALANTVLEKEREEETIFQLASSGFSSTVRLAKSHGEMWVPIFMQNKENVLDVLNEHISQLRKFKSALEKENWELLEELIQNANKIRNILRE